MAFKSDFLDSFVQDVENIFQKAMSDGKWAVALKAKELLARVAGLLNKESGRRSFEDWSDDEIKSLLDEIEGTQRKRKY